MSLFALWSEKASSYFTYRQLMIVHDNRAEMEFLFPNTRVVNVPEGIGKTEVIHLKNHPSMASIRWPLKKEDFW